MRKRLSYRVFCLLVAFGFFAAGALPVFADAAECAAGSSDENLFFFLYDAVKERTGDFFSMLACIVSVVLFLLIRKYLIPLLDRLLETVTDDGKEKRDVPRDEEPK